MTLYTSITKSALTSALTDADSAWESGKAWAARHGLGTESSRNKGCPRATFVSLARHGYITGFVKKPDRPLGNNAYYVLMAYKLLLENPLHGNQKQKWWRAVARQCGVDRQDQNGVLDVLLALLEEKRFSATSIQSGDSANILGEPE